MQLHAVGRCSLTENDTKTQQDTEKVSTSQPSVSHILQQSGRITSTTTHPPHLAFPTIQSTFGFVLVIDLTQSNPPVAVAAVAAAAPRTLHLDTTGRSLAVKPRPRPRPGQAIASFWELHLRYPVPRTPYPISLSWWECSPPGRSFVPLHPSNRDSPSQHVLRYVACTACMASAWMVVVFAMARIRFDRIGEGIGASPLHLAHNWVLV